MRIGKPFSVLNSMLAEIMVNDARPLLSGVMNCCEWCGQRLQTHFSNPAAFQKRLAPHSTTKNVLAKNGEQIVAETRRIHDHQTNAIVTMEM